jgi:hypothetical protein
MHTNCGSENCEIDKAGIKAVVVVVVRFSFESKLNR